MSKKFSILDPRAEALSREDIITPMHHHNPGEDFYVAQTEEGKRRVSLEEAARLVQQANTVPGVHEVDPEEGRRGFDRRMFVRSGTIGAGALALATAAPKMAFAAGAKDLLVTVFLRGGMDGLSAVVPVTDPAYYKARPNIAVKPEQTFALNSAYGMNKHMLALKPLWDAKQVAVVLGTGNPAVTRSHFEDQALCEQAAPAVQRSGWIGRHLATSSSTSGTFRAISVGNQVALSMATTAHRTLAMSSVSEFNIYAWDSVRSQVMKSIDSLYASAGGTAQAEAQMTLKAVNELARVRDVAYTPANGAVYPESPFGKGMRDVARMAKAGVGLEAATVDFGDWDMHNRLGLAANATDWFSRHSRMLAETLAAFAKDLGTQWARTTVVVMSEFGRRVAENGNLGLDHGHGNVFWVLGGGVNGGVYGSMPTLTDANLLQGDVPITVDYRRPLSEVVSKRLGNGANLAKVFPGYTQQAPLGLAKTA